VNFKLQIPRDTAPLLVSLRGKSHFIITQLATGIIRMLAILSCVIADETKT